MKKTVSKKIKGIISAILASAMAISLLPFKAGFDVYAEDISDSLVKMTYNGHTYAVINQPITWSDSKVLCESLGGHLATVSDAAEQEFLNQLAQKTGNYKVYWLGGQRDTSTGEWFWITDEPFNYINWDKGEPNNSSGYENYLQMYGDNSITTAGVWNDNNDAASGNHYNNPNVQIAAICEWETSEEFAIEATYNGKKYRLYEHHMKWSEAKEYCEKVGGHLITVTDAEEEKFFEDLIRIGQNVMYWMGGKYDFDQSKWEWITGESFTYTNWDYGEPNNYRRSTDGERESCMMIYKQPNYGVSNSKAYTWNDSFDDGCLPGQEDFFFTDNFGFVCEFEYELEIPQNVTLKQTKDGISINWDVTGGKTAGYIVYKKDENGNLEPISDLITENHFEDNFKYTNGVYTYAVAVKDPNGFTGELSEEISITIDLLLLPTPSGVTVDTGGSRIEIKWDAPESDDVAYFRIYRKSGDVDFALIKDNYKYLNYFDNDIELGIKYTYCVTAVDNNGNESLMSETVSGSISDDKVSPEILSIYPENGAVLNTNQVIGVSARDNFRLSKIVAEIRAAGGEWQTVFTEDDINNYGKSIQFDLDTSEFTTGNYELRIYASDTAGNDSEYVTNSYSFKECELSVPVLTATGEGWRNELSWTMENTDDLLGYRVYRKILENGKYSLIASITNNEYTDNNLTPGITYYYMVEAADSRNNYIKSNEAASVPTNNDDIIPLADAGSDVMGIAGEEISFNGSKSWDNHYVASYEWDFGDGSAAEGVKVSHSYEKDGTYDVTLTVSDSAGNSDSHTIKAYIYSNDYGTVQFKTRVQGSGAIIGNVNIYCEIPGIDSTDFATDASGNFKFIAPKGTYDVYFYKNGYLPQYEQITVTEESFSQQIELEQKNLVDGKLTSKELDIDEIIERGIDINDPANQFVYEYTVECVEYENSDGSGNGKKSGQFTFTVNSEGDIIGDVNADIPNNNGNVFTSAKSITGSSGRPSRSGGSGRGSGGGSGNNAPVSVAIFNVSTQLSWLKQFYEVELMIFNNADDEFFIQNSQAVLTLPENGGLVLADTDRKENLTQIMGDNGVIGGNATEYATWVVRGDKPGSYDLSAEFTGVLMPFGEYVSVLFKTEKPLVVQDGSDLKLEITVAEGDGYWTHQFTFTNNRKVTDPNDEEEIKSKSIYNFTASFSGSGQLAEFTEMIIEYPDESIEIATINNGVPDLENSDFFLPALIDGEEKSIYDHRTIKPGETVTGYFTIYRRDEFTNDD